MANSHADAEHENCQNAKKNQAVFHMLTFLIRSR